jgi:outer membrane murein-binding lipoprotein Lpp
MRKLTIAALVAGTLLAGCTPAKVPTTSNAQTENAASNAQTESVAPASKTAEACPNDGLRLPLSGVCQSGGENYLKLSKGPRPLARKGCEWVVNEAAMPANEVLLYLAAKCQDKTATLEFSGGARAAEVSIVSSSMAGDLAEGKGILIARVYTADGSNPQASVLGRVRDGIEDEAQRAKCVVSPAKRDDWPGDAILVDDPTANRPAGKLVTSMCGPYGYSTDSSAFWRILGDFAWYFDLGQSFWEVDPGSFTIVKAAASQPAG